MPFRDAFHRHYGAIRALLERPAARSRFQKEAHAPSRLNYPNIASVYDFDTHEGVDYLVMELVPGVSLDGKLRAGPLTEAETVDRGRQLAQGLEAAHREGIIHRDLKPGNLRVTPDGRLKIPDFGLARLLPSLETEAPTATLTHTLAGTPAYMAPEQLRGKLADEPHRRPRLRRRALRDGDGKTPVRRDVGTPPHGRDPPRGPIRRARCHGAPGRGPWARVGTGKEVQRRREDDIG